MVLEVVTRTAGRSIHSYNRSVVVPGKGTTFHSKYNYRGKSFDMDHEISAFDPPNTLGTRSTEGPFSYDGHLVLTESDGGTVVSNTVEVGSDSWMTSVMFAVAAPLMRRMMRGQLVKELKAMKRELDGTDS